MNQRKGKDLRFTTMFDLYKLPKGFPKLDESKKINKPIERVKFLEESLMNDIQDYRFIPYIQLHEFEALILSEPEKFKIKYIGYDAQIKKLIELAGKFKTPELINDGEETAPSKRIIKIIPEYKKQKPNAGPMIAQEIGLETIRKKCPHFNEWITKLETLGR